MADQEACSRIEQPSVITFLVAEGCKPVEIHRRMSTVYGATCFSQKNVYKWATLFKEGAVLRMKADMEVGLDKYYYYSMHSRLLKVSIFPLRRYEDLHIGAKRLFPALLGQ